jgi:predicted nucleotidyltransferase
LSNPTKFPEINRLLQHLLEDIQKVLGDRLLGFYLCGSLVWGDFDYDVSDIDLLAVTSNDMTDSDFSDLKEMHNDFAKAHPRWDNRIEVQYASESGLKTFRRRSSKMAVISPGEPFHVIDAGMDWVTNWFFALDYGLTLFGPLPDQFIDPISKDEFVQAVYDHALFWQQHVKQTRNARPYQSYAVLTLCRALYTVAHKQQVSKKRAADWAMSQLPEWADFIKEALYIRSHAGETTQADADRAYPKTERFVFEVIEKVKQAGG